MIVQSMWMRLFCEVTRPVWLVFFEVKFRRKLYVFLEHSRFGPTTGCDGTAHPKLYAIGEHSALPLHQRGLPYLYHAFLTHRPY